MNFEFWKDVVADTAIDVAKIFPFLFVTYILMEYIEHRTGEKSLKWLKKSGPLGPIIGAVTGILPQCGFSAAASNLYAARVISLGSLIAVYLSTSDEMLPLLISNQIAPKTIALILVCKAGIGLVFGMLLDIVLRGFEKGKHGGRKSVTADDRDKSKEGKKTKNVHGHDHGDSGDGAEEHHIHDLCEREHCDCEKDGIFISALKHSLHILLFILLISFAMNVFMKYIGSAGIQYVTIGQSYGIVILASLFGLVPNCGVSVALTQLYIGGMIGEGALMSGLLTGAGVGLLVLLRVNRPFKDTIRVTLILWVIGVLAGCLIKALGITFI